MPDDLGEFEIRTREESQREEERFGTSTPPPSRPGWPPLVFVVSLIALGIGAVLFFVARPKARPVPAASPEARAASTPAPERKEALPRLEGSDAWVRRVAAGLSSHSEATRWLGRTDLVRTLTVVVSNIADGETPRPHLAFLAPPQRFRAVGGHGRRIVVDPASSVGYDAFGDAVASVDAAGAASAYRATEPLFDAAYRELGHPEGFRGALDRAIRALLEVPVPPPDARLLPRGIGFRWADARFEALTAAQKQFLRTGPRNVGRVQAKLREVQAALSLTSAAP